jgi:ATP-dependent DNA helicase RecG
MDGKTLIPGKAYVIFGKPGFFNGKAQMAHPEMELYSPANLGQQWQPNFTTCL